MNAEVLNMKNKWMILLSVLVAVLAIVVAVLWNHNQQMRHLTPQEKEAMEFLPGYSFLFEGERIEIKEKWTHKGFLEQHRMVPFLEDIVPLLQTCHWQKDRPPIEVTETEDTVIVVVPPWPTPPSPEKRIAWFGRDYMLKLIYDKQTGKRIWGRSGF